jgi:hypothetical protein
VTRFLAAAAIMALLSPTLASAGDLTPKQRLAALVTSSQGEKRMSPRPTTQLVCAGEYVRCGKPVALASAANQQVVRRASAGKGNSH